MIRDRKPFARVPSVPDALHVSCARPAGSRLFSSRACETWIVVNTLCIRCHYRVWPHRILTPDPAQPQPDVTQLCPSSPGCRLLSTFWLSLTRRILVLSCQNHRCLRCKYIEVLDDEYTKGLYTVMHIYGVSIQKAFILR